jgi:hypothetical protein
MDSRNYPQIVRDLLNQHVQTEPLVGDIEVETIFDLEHDSPIGDALRTL